jgi:hypothetical protein
MTVEEDANTSMETESTVSEASAAIVSVYNSWSTTSENSSFYDNDDTLLLEGDRLLEYAFLPERESINSEELLKELKKRVKEEDLPPTPLLRRRRLPACQFLNFMGSRRNVDHGSKSEALSFAGLHPPLMVFELPCSQEIFLGIEDKDTSFPPISSKVKYLDDESPASKKPKLDDSMSDDDDVFEESVLFAVEEC